MTLTWAALVRHPPGFLSVSLLLDRWKSDAIFGKVIDCRREQYSSAVLNPVQYGM